MLAHVLLIHLDLAIIVGSWRALEREHFGAGRGYLGGVRVLGKDELVADWRCPVAQLGDPSSETCICRAGVVRGAV